MQYKTQHVYRRSDCCPENNAIVCENVVQNPKTSIRHRAQQLHVKNSFDNILTKNPKLKTYKTQLTKELKSVDHLFYIE